MRVVGLLFSLVLLGCNVDVGSGDDSDGGNKTLQYSFTQEINGVKCETGTHTFSSLTDMCIGLADDQRNDFCAEDARCDRFKRDCQGINLNGVTCD